MMYQELKLHISAIESYVNFYNDVLGSYPKNGIGMVAEENRDTKYQNARMEYRKWFNKLRNANSYLVKNFKNEYAEERKLKRAV